MKNNAAPDKSFMDMLYRDLKEYENSFDDITLKERKDLRQWVKDGNSVYENPGLFSCENGDPMDYITAVRIIEDMRKNPGDYQFGQITGERMDDDSSLYGIPF
jgi:hypothetical protein